MSRLELVIGLLAAAGLAGCSAPPPPVASVAHAEEVDAPAPTGPAQSFGTPLDADLPTTELADLQATPHAYAGQLVKTEGTVSRVCQRMGCWMELRGDAGGEPVRVPMAGHRFFLPRDCAGRHAIVEGRVQVAELTQQERAHLEGEGAAATSGAFAIEANGVELR